MANRKPAFPHVPTLSRQEAEDLLPVDDLLSRREAEPSDRWGFRQHQQEQASYVKPFSSRPINVRTKR